MFRRASSSTFKSRWPHSDSGANPGWDGRWDGTEHAPGFVWFNSSGLQTAFGLSWFLITAETLDIALRKFSRFNPQTGQTETHRVGHILDEVASVQRKGLSHGLPGYHWTAADDGHHAPVVAVAAVDDTAATFKPNTLTPYHPSRLLQRYEVGAVSVQWSTLDEGDVGAVVTDLATTWDALHAASLEYIQDPTTHDAFRAARNAYLAQVALYRVPVYETARTYLEANL